ncbi:hypothetical protein [Pseudomonas sp. LRF_L74]|uniref:hypothetical protein n=1 Tax=Pseudomonas sp. LRF_L74 TaxID=3369422 RepID=UPI003F638652
MNAPLSILGTGMVTAVGHDAPSSCAAIRCAIDNFQETRFIDRGGEWQLGASVTLEKPWGGRSKLLKMLVSVLGEALRAAPEVDPSSTPLMLALAESDRPGRLHALDASLLHDAQREMGVALHPDSAVIARGRVGAAVAMLNARKLIHQNGHRHVLVAGVDSLLVSSTLAEFERRERLLTSRNSNGFIPGEAAAAVVLGAPVQSEQPQLLCSGLGFAMEQSTIDSEDMPLRADGLTRALQGALAEAGCGMEAMDYRLTDLSGEQYYFKEASLALSRTLRVRKEFLHLWHPADCIGECGAAIGPAMLAVALASCRKGYGEGNNILLHLGNDAGERAAVVLDYRTVRAA